MMTVFHVSHPVEWTVTGAGNKLPSVLKWSSEDPLAVMISFGDATGEVKWTFARDLLADVISGKCDAAGDGDVHVSRSVNHGLSGPGKAQLILVLSVNHKAMLRADLEQVKFFLDSTFIYSPWGAEIVDIDTTIVRLLDGGWENGRETSV
jgi:hypothetical protein